MWPAFIKLNKLYRGTCASSTRASSTRASSQTDDYFIRLQTVTLPYLRRIAVMIGIDYENGMKLASEINKWIKDGEKNFKDDDDLKLLRDVKDMLPRSPRIGTEFQAVISGDVAHEATQPKRVKFQEISADRVRCNETVYIKNRENIYTEVRFEKFLNDRQVIVTDVDGGSQMILPKELVKTEQNGTIQDTVTIYDKDENMYFLIRKTRPELRNEKL